MTLTTHPEWQALIAGICTEPYDDLRRLVAADWLTEQGEEEYAEFVRLQVELTAVGFPSRITLRTACSQSADPHPPAPGSPAELSQQTAILLSRNAARWCPGPWFDRPVRYVTDWLWRHGFVDVVRAPLSWLIGGECERCRNGVWIIPNTVSGRFERGAGNSEVSCPYCHGTGRTPAHLDELVRVQPITRVVVTGIQVGEVEAGWYIRNHSTSEFPASVLAICRTRFFNCEKDALDTFSLSLLNPARERAGLPPFTPPNPWR